MILQSLVIFYEVPGIVAGCHFPGPLVQGALAQLLPNAPSAGLRAFAGAGPALRGPVGPVLWVDGALRYVGTGSAEAPPSAGADRSVCETVADTR